ncbi:contractile injection system protein, VgrG/Pvc8 family [Janthinobacterium sp. PC23-8]|uniref:contractile injection system protein, VgrG/Pvc8 family n=1 Tax=Janthinobacterium sp. PC23-8 TaxID=2012679 RepID=UPI000B97AAEF|nr:contractile injection system protein, VgrG/Pvc8 family [Janthinobacterium sp. PC23-8]OYO27465.1 hypothetical protein CD932_19995 [Janthinobacterium sp. PC23-8]
MNQRLDPLAASAVAPIDDPRPALFLHSAIFLRGNRIVSDETFRLTSFSGQESASETFEYQLELHGNTVRHREVAFTFDDIIGRPVTVGIQYPSGDSQAELSDRFQRAIRGAGGGAGLALFNGIVSAFALEMNGVYRLTMKPALAKLALTNRYRVHAQKNVRDAIGDILDEHRIAYTMEAVSGDDNPAVARIQDWLQAGESDLDFIKRMMGKAHLYYFFSHGGNQHRAVFANRPAYPWALASRQPLRYTYTGEDEAGLAQSDVISQFSYQQTLASSGVQTVFARQEAAWESDAVAQYQTYAASSVADPGQLPFQQYKIYQYGGSVEEARHFAGATGDALDSAASQFSGSSYCPHFRAGHQFSVTGSKLVDSHPQLVRPTLEGQAFVLTQVKHQASLDGGYTNEFQATRAQGLISAFSMQETQQGSLLARVVAVPDAAVPPDWRYYAAATPYDAQHNQFTDGQARLDAIGVYVIFSTAGQDSEPVWVKLAPSMQTAPEIGVTVVVARAQDESELPEIQSIIHSNGNTCIMPEAWVASSRTGNNYSTSYGDGKSVRFGTASSADLPRAVGIVEKTYSSGRYRDTSYAQGASYSFAAADSVAAASSSNLQELFGALGGVSDLLSASESFGSTFSRQQASVSSSVSTVDTSYSHSTVGSSTSISHVTSQNNTSTMGDSVSHDITGTTSSTQAVGVSSSTQATGMSNNVSVTGMSTAASLTGVANSSNATGISNNSSATGESNNSSATGVSNNASVTGVSNSTALTGVSDSVNLTGASTQTNLTGKSDSVAITGVSTSLSVNGEQTTTNVSGLNKSLNVTGSSSTINLSGAITSLDLSGFGMRASFEAATVKCEISGLAVTMPAIKIYI